MQDDKLLGSVHVDGDIAGIAGSNINNNAITNITNNNNFYQDVPKEEKKTLKDGNPYMGLNQFTADNRDKFFGREQLTEELCQLLLQKKENVLLLVGASGSGKSSLIRAGLIPRLKEIRDPFNPFRNITFVPNNDPFEYLRECLRATYDPVRDRDKREIVQSLSAETLVQVVKSLKTDRWLIFIDQFEQIFTRTPEAICKSFTKSLLELIEAYEQDQTFKIILAMRVDFLEEFPRYPELKQIYNRYTNKMVSDLSDEELKSAIEKPAALHGVKFEENSKGKLVDQIIKDFRKRPGLLPLLQYTLSLLWEKDDVSDRVLNWQTYDELGGVTGALNQHSNEAYNSLKDPEKQEAVKQILLKVVTLDRLDKQKLVSQRAVKSQFDSTQKEVLEELIRAGLLVSKGDQEATVEVAHEALLESWDIVNDVIQKEREFIIIKSDLERDAAQWYEHRKQDEEKAKKDLLDGWKLERAIKLEQSKFDLLDSKAQDYIKASQDWRGKQKRQEEYQRQQEKDQQQREKDQQQQKLKNARLTAFAAVSVGLIMAGLALTLGNQLKLSKARQIQALISSSEANLASGAELDAMVDVLRANKTLRQSILLSAFPIEGLREQVLNGLSKARHTAQEYNRLNHSDDVNDVVFSPDGQLIASATVNNTVKLWNLKGKELQTFQHNGEVKKVVFSPNGQIIASASKDETVKLWDLEGRLLHTLQNIGPVNSVVFSPNGETIASASNDGIVRLWNLQGEELHALRHESAVFGVVFSPDGQIIASASKDNRVRLWNLKGQLLQTLPHDNFAYTVVFSPDGQVLASASRDNTVRLWNLEGKLLHTLQHNDQVGSVAFSKDGQIIASASHDNTVKLWNLEGKLLKILPHSEDATQVVFSPNGGIIASSSNNNTVKLWNLDGRELQTLHHGGNVSKIVFSKDGQLIASASKDNTVKLWDLKDKALQTLHHSSDVTGIEFSKDEQAIVSTSKDNTVRLWNLNSNQSHLSLQHFNVVNDVALSPDGQIIASASDDDTVKLGNLSGKELGVLWHDDAAESVVFSPDGQTIASASQDKTVKLWDLKGQKLHSLPHKDVVYRVVFSKDGQTIASASFDGIVKLWNLNGQELHTLKHDAPVFSVAISPSGKMIASGDKVGTIKLWNSEGKPLHILLHRDEVRNIEFSPDGKIIATASFDNTVKLWNLKGKPLHTLPHNDAVKSVVFSPDGKIIATASFDNTVKLWNLKGKLLHTFPHSDVVNSVVFSKDGQTVASASNDGTVKLWKVENFDQVFEQVCNWMQGYLANNSSVEKNDRHLCD